MAQQVCMGCDAADRALGVPVSIARAQMRGQGYQCLGVSDGAGTTHRSAAVGDSRLPIADFEGVEGRQGGAQVHNIQSCAHGSIGT